MRRTLMLWMIMTLAILPLMAAAQPVGETPEGGVVRRISVP
jgi:hypothetical protein